MCRGWKGLALVATWWCLNVAAQAQTGTYPSQLGAARMPQPIPNAPSPAPLAPEPNLVPGPINPQQAPPGPPDSLSLPYDHTGAFQTEEYGKEHGFYVDVGPMALQHNHLGAGDIAVVNSHAVGLGNGSSAIPNPFNPPPAGITGALNFNSVTPPLSLGITGTVGYLWDNQSIELSAFYIWENDVSRYVNQPFSFDSMFYNPPLAFIGAGMFRYADSVGMNFGSSLTNAELNYRRWNSSFFNGVDFIFGVRAMRENDLLTLTSSGTALIKDTNALGLASPGENSIAYSVIAHNNIVAPQLGLEWNLPIFKWLTLCLLGKGAWGVNYLTTDVNLTRTTDGLTAFNTSRHATVFAQVYQLGAFADINLLEKLRLRLGYSAFWLTGVAAAVDQVDFNLQGQQARDSLGFQGLVNAFKGGDLKSIFGAENSYPHGRINNNGSMIFYGPQVQLQFFF